TRSGTCSGSSISTSTPVARIRNIPATRPTRTRSCTGRSNQIWWVICWRGDRRVTSTTRTERISRGSAAVADFEAFVLTGGRSERMGRDKALLEIDGVPMARRVTDELERAGAARVRCVGGDAAELIRLGLDAVDDEHPGAGPLAGLLVALRVSSLPITLVAPCDLIDPRRDGFAD